MNYYHCHVTFVKMCGMQIVLNKEDPNADARRPHLFFCLSAFIGIRQCCVFPLSRSPVHVPGAAGQIQTWAYCSPTVQHMINELNRQLWRPDLNQRQAIHVAQCPDTNTKEI